MVMGCGVCGRGARGLRVCVRGGCAWDVVCVHGWGVGARMGWGRLRFVCRGVPVCAFSVVQVCVCAREAVRAGACAWMGLCVQTWRGGGGLRVCLQLCVCSVQRCGNCCCFDSSVGEEEARGTFSLPWPMGALLSPSLPEHQWSAWGTSMGQGHGTQAVGHGLQQAGAGRGAVPGGRGRNLVPFSALSLIPPCPGAEAFCISQKPKILPGDKIWLPFSWGEKTKAASGLTTESLNEGV